MRAFYSKDTNESIMVNKRIILSGDNLIDAQPSFDNLNNETVVVFLWIEVGSQKFGQDDNQKYWKKISYYS